MDREKESIREEEEGGGWGEAAKEEGEKVEEWPTELLLLNVGRRCAIGSLTEYPQILRRGVVVCICLWS